MGASSDGQDKICIWWSVELTIFFSIFKSVLDCFFIISFEELPYGWEKKVLPDGNVMYIE
jgi:hypothetical protein